MLRYLIVLFLIAFTTSCNSNNSEKETTEKTVKSYDYQISIEIWNPYFGSKSKFILNNLDLNLAEYHSLNVQKTKSFTLYQVSIEPEETKNVSIDTTEIPISRALSDTLFLLTKAFIESIQLNNYDTLPSVIQTPTDDSNFSVELLYRRKKLNVSIYGFNSSENKSKELTSLLTFLNKFESKEKK